MELIARITDVLASKGSEVWSVSRETTVFEAIQQMAQRNVGALVVLDRHRLVGIVSERDYTRKVILKGRSSKRASVEEIMTQPVVTIPSSASVGECMRLMTDRRIRHVPVLEGQKLVGMLSIGDLMKWTIDSQSAALDQLERFVSGSYPA